MKVFVVVDSNIIFQCWGLLLKLSQSGVTVVIPRAVYEELEGANNKAMFRIKRGNRFRGDKLAKWRLALKFWPLVRDAIKEQSGNGWMVAGSYQTGLFYRLTKYFGCRPKDLNSNEVNDLRVLATCVHLKEEDQGDVVKLLTGDNDLRDMVRDLLHFSPDQKIDIQIPRWHWNHQYRKMEFDINEILN